MPAAPWQRLRQKAVAGSKLSHCYIEFRLLSTKHGSAPAFGGTMAAMLTCETCGRTPADTLFSLRMRKRCRCLDPQVVRFQRCFGYVLCTWRSRRAARGYDRRWQLYVENGYVHVGHTQRRWLCREHAPFLMPNPNATACATFECPFPATSATQMRNTRSKRFCDQCKTP